MVSMDSGRVQELKLFVNLCESDPATLNHPSLGFFRSYVHSLGGHIPHNSRNENYKSCRSDSDHYDEIIESDIEFDGDIVEADNDPPQMMGDPSVEITDEQHNAAQGFKAKAMDAISEGKLQEALGHLTEAVVTNPTSAILYAARAAVYVKLMKPNAAIRDADAALQINPEFARGYKARGMAEILLGRWEDAAHDLHLAAKLDYDEEINTALKKVEPNIRKIEEHRRKYECLRKERELHQAACSQECQSTSWKQPEMPDLEVVTNLEEGAVLLTPNIEDLKTKFRLAQKLSRLLILYFTASWCGPCRFISPHYASLAGKYPKVIFLKVDIDELSAVAAQWKISSVPSFIFINDGKEVDRVIGVDKIGLEKKIMQHSHHS